MQTKTCTVVHTVAVVSWYSPKISHNDHLDSTIADASRCQLHQMHGHRFFADSPILPVNNSLRALQYMKGTIY